MASSNDTGCAKTIGIVAGIATIIGVVIAILAWLLPFNPIGPSPLGPQQTQPVVLDQASETTTSMHSTDSPTNPTAISGPIPFSSPNEPSILNPILGWQPGSSLANSYDLEYYPNALLLTAGTDTVQYAGYDDTAPYITYNIQGDFDAQVKVVFSPSQDTQAASLGVRSVENRNIWLRISRYHFGGQIIWVVGNRDASELSLNSVSYTSDTVHFKIERRRFLFTLSYSANGSNWIPLQKEYVFEMPNDVEIFLSVYSIFNSEAVKAAFYDFVVVDR